MAQRILNLHIPSVVRCLHPPVGNEGLIAALYLDRAYDCFHALAIIENIGVIEGFFDCLGSPEDFGLIGPEDGEVLRIPHLEYVREKAHKNQNCGNQTGYRPEKQFLPHKARNDEDPKSYIYYSKHLKGPLYTEEVSHDEAAQRRTQDGPNGVVGKDFPHGAPDPFPVFGMDTSGKRKGDTHKKAGTTM